MKKGILLINLGTPDSPKRKDVKRYLTQFLNDPRVIDINPVGRFLLVNGIIVPFRSRFAIIDSWIELKKEIASFSW
jgi:ferrochelatase